jgi:ribosomal protein S27AE
MSDAIKTSGITTSGDGLVKSDRRSFLRGSALFAAAIGLSVVPGLARQQQPPQPKPEEGEEKPPAENPFGEGGKSKDGKLYDKEGREYRICPQCGYNMYKQGRMWVCENCGYSYVE